MPTGVTSASAFGGLSPRSPASQAAELVQSSRLLGRLLVEWVDQANRSPIPDGTKSDSQDEPGNVNLKHPRE
jgi:hypothetical protein